MLAFVLYGATAGLRHLPGPPARSGAGDEVAPAPGKRVFELLDAETGHAEWASAGGPRARVQPVGRRGERGAEAGSKLRGVTFRYPTAAGTFAALDGTFVDHQAGRDRRARSAPGAPGKVTIARAAAAGLSTIRRSARCADGTGDLRSIDTGRAPQPHRHGSAGAGAPPRKPRSPRTSATAKALRHRPARGRGRLARPGGNRATSSVERLHEAYADAESRERVLVAALRRHRRAGAWPSRRRDPARPRAVMILERGATSGARRGEPRALVSRALGGSCRRAAHA